MHYYFIIVCMCLNSRRIVTNVHVAASASATFKKHTTGGLIGNDFRSKQALLMVHVWMVHKRILMEGKDGEHVQECLFDELWEDTSARIRSHGINIISVRILSTILSAAYLLLARKD